MPLILFALIFVIKPDGQSFEQTALDYFIEELIPKHYKSEEIIYFSGETESIESIGGPFSECFERDSAFTQFYQRHNDIASKSLDLNFRSTMISKANRPKKHQLYLRIYKAVRMDNSVFVYLKVYKRQSHVDHFLIKMSMANLDEITFCHKDEII